MARINNLTNFLNDVATAIKTKLGDNTSIPAAEFDSKIMEIETAGNYQTKSISITTNGNYTQLPDTGYDAMDQVVISVNVPQTGGDVKLFKTIEEMRADTTAKEGDLAVVYREEIQPVTEENEFSSCIFPNTVVLDEAFTGNVYGRFRAVDHSVMFDGNVDMSSSRFRFDGWGESSQIRVEYTSQDGITYTRTDGGEELQEFGTTIKWTSMGGPFNNVIGNFMKIGGNYFDGLYEYTEFKDKYFQLPIVDGADDTSRVPYDYDNTIIDYAEFINLAENYLFDSMNGDRYCIGKFNNKYYIIERTIKTGYEDGYALGVIETSAKTYSLALRHNGDNIPSLIFNELDLDTYTIINTQTVTFNEVGSTYDGYKWYYNSNITMNCLPIIMDSNNGFRCSVYYDILPLNGNTRTSYFIDDLINYVPYYKYSIAKSQLNATPDYVYEKTFYGKNGVENGTLTTSVSNSFTDVNAEVYAKIQVQYNNMQPRILTDQDKDIDKNIITIPSKTDGTPLLNTSNVTNMVYMFSGCSSLTTIPLLNTSNVTNMGYMFSSCSSLNNESLNNILAMCTNAVKITSNKTLKRIGLTEEQANICKTLSNYQDFVNAGWTTGY